ncbi:Protein kinase domain [Trypanosoma melophagium]|uniref:Protein kinase domain n=1 Tax=Trypanosoma melophagium TaxID=715481 RepID=UPI00351A1A10|nr:Protein kinase domain [Trypanosoma melophagium]
MSSPTWSVYEGGWGEVSEETDSLPPELSLKGSGLQRVRLLKRGAQGAVYVAKDMNNNVFAVKRLFMQRSDFGIRGISENALREVTLLSLISKDSSQDDMNRDFGVIRLYNVVEAPYHELCLVMEMCPLDLSQLVIQKTKKLYGARILSKDPPVRCPLLAKICVIQYLMRGILQILKYLHDDCHIIHRDIKLSNFLVHEDGRIRLTDFGSARLMHDTIEISSDASSGEYTPSAIRSTIIYEAPECLLGNRVYTSAIDIWAAGVVFAELLLQQHLFKSRSELAILSDIWKLLGTPSDDDSSATTESSVTYLVRTEPTLPLKFPEEILPAEGLDLLQRMLELDPNKRITTSEALSHPFLNSADAERHCEEGRRLWQTKSQTSARESEKSVNVGMQALCMPDDSSDECEDISEQNEDNHYRYL